MATKGYWQQFHRQRITRRRLLTTVGATGAGLAVVAACGGGGGGDGDNGPSPDGDAVRGGTLKFSTQADWGTIDPVTSVAAGPAMFPRIYNCLLDRSRRQPGFFFMDLAESVEQPDEVTCVFTMRNGVLIAPNDLGIPEREMDSADAMSWLDRVNQDTNAVAHAFAESWIASYEAPDGKTFIVETAGPYAYFLFRIGTPLGGTIPPREFFEQGISLANQGVGAGPWVLRPGSYGENGRAIVDRNVNYYRSAQAAGGQNLPYIDSIQWVQITDRQPRRLAFVDGQIHTYGALDRVEMEDLRRQIPNVVVAEEPVNTYISFTMKPTSPPWDNDNVRRAASAALNRQEFVDRVVGIGGGQVNGLVHWPLGDFALPPEELANLQPFDPQLSRQLIQESGFDLPLKIDVIYPVTDIEFHDRHLPIFLMQMEAAGFDVNQVALDFATWLARYQNLEYDASLSPNQIYETPEIPLDWHSSTGPQGDSNFAIGVGALHPEIDEAILASKRETDPIAQVEAVRQVQRDIYAVGPAFLPIMSWVNFTLRHGFLKNVTDGLGSTGLYLTSEWWLGAGFPAGIVGDVSCDGRVNSIDAALVLQRDAGLLSQLPCSENADVNLDGLVNSLDAALILQHDAGFLPTLPP